MTNITLPKSVTVINYGAFSYCNNLTAAKFLGNAPSVEPKVFGGITPQFKVYSLIEATLPGILQQIG
ncbi:hypothetical protein JK636_00845 [Clostridium sp. YIM B02515]|uniref:Leucine-rich repeat domain-containing protein n=1 Tax=Clostridium rhizosphaerae TaxID=2803861 RepID=A0ABS1T8G4_9CLOT|nr:hypothetical protein [Clostridium rhizosphaerae]